MTEDRMYRGDSWLAQWCLTGQRDRPVDISGASARVHQRTASGDLLLDATPYASVTGPTGTVSLAVPYPVMEAIPPGTYRYDVELTWPVDIRRTIDAGTLIIEQDVTL